MWGGCQQDELAIRRMIALSSFWFFRMRRRVHFLPLPPCSWYCSPGTLTPRSSSPSRLSIFHPSLELAAESGHSPQHWPQPQQDVELSICVCVDFCSFFSSSHFFFLWFCVLADFFTSRRIWKGHEIFFFRHDFQHSSFSLTLCLLRLRSNRFHMLLQLTSVLNYFTCDLQYFLRKSVRYLLRANKINLSCSLSFLSLVPFLSFVTLSLPLVVGLKGGVIVLLELLMLSKSFFFRKQFPSIHKMSCRSGLGWVCMCLSEALSVSHFFSPLFCHLFSPLSLSVSPNSTLLLSQTDTVQRKCLTLCCVLLHQTW